jgi:hypothetical protein
MQKVQCTNVQGGRDNNSSTSSHQFFREFDTSVSVVEAAIDVRRGNANKSLCTK